MPYSNRRPYSTLARSGPIIALLLFASAPEAIGQANDTNTDHQNARSITAEGDTRAALPKPQGSGSQKGANDTEHPGGRHPLTIWDHIGRFFWRLIRDPLSDFTLLLAIFGGLQFELSRRTSQRQLRAYLFPNSATIIDATHGNTQIPASNIPALYMTIRNSGQTPAYNVSVWAWISVIDPANEHTLTLPNITKEKSNALGAGSEMPKNMNMGRALTQSERDDILAGVKRIYVHGRAEYVTLGKKRFTNFRLHYWGEYPPALNMTLNYSLGGNEAN